ncbi:MAG TPA: hemolysin family protein [Gemmatimonadales bacterium]|nr:hemolysin family protein [Gemmatimonadales bacterium]
MASVGLGIVSVVVLVLANAFFVAAEFALVGTRKSRLEELIQQGERKAILARRAVQSLDRYISATQLGITLASLGLGWIGEPALAHLIDGAFSWLPDAIQPYATHGAAVVVAFSIITVLHIILGELVPKAMALLYPEHVSMWVTAPLMGFTWVMSIPISALNGTANALLNLLGINPPGEHERLHSPDEIRILVEQSEEGGSLGAQDARLLEGVFEFGEKTAQDVMTPRTRMVALEAESSVQRAAAVIAAAGRSRYPVYGDDLDDVTGVVHAKAILAALREDPARPLKEVMRPPLFVPGTRKIEDVLGDMKRQRTHLALVLDEYGGTAGLVTMEDLLEEIVGDIEDEYDRAERPAAQPDGASLLDGGLPLSDLPERAGIEIDDENYTTLGGYLFGRLGRLPKVGDQVKAAERTFEVVEMEGRRVKSVRLLPAGGSSK